jgi:phage terminase large subunit-like protein
MGQAQAGRARRQTPSEGGLVAGDVPRFTDEQLAELTPAELEDYERLLEAEEKDWDAVARDSQREPPGEWGCWLFMGGRGAGKTKAICEALRRRVRLSLSRESGLIGPTAADTREVLVEGPAGVLACCTRAERPMYEPSRRRLAWPNGAVTHTYSADEPERLRGPQHDLIVGDELRAWRYLREALDNALLGLRMGADPRAILATTPSARPELRELLERPGVVVTRDSVYSNLANLSAEFAERVIARYEGTRLGRAELHGELVEDVEGALFRHAWLDACRVMDPPHGGYRAAVVGLDPADPADEGSEQGLCVAAVGRLDRDLYVLGSEAHRLRVGDFLTQAIELALRHDASLVVERNFGGQAWRDLLDRAMRERGVTVPVREVWASKGKRPRAENAALLAEQGRLHMVGSHPELEDELCTWTGARGERFDRGDAMVWAVAELAYNVGAAAPAGESVLPWSDEPPTEGGAVVAWDGAMDWDTPLVNGEALERWIHPS